MTRYGFIFNLDTCGDLRGCMMACKVKTNSFLGSHYTETKTCTSGEFPNPNMYFLPMRCQHCGNPSCVSACPSKVFTKREDGIVAVGDTSLCKNCEDKPCLDACPYGAIDLDTTNGCIGKCDMCADLIDGGGEPACAHACCTNSIFFGDFDNEYSAVSQGLAGWREQGVAHELLPENDPAMHYIVSNHEWTGLDHVKSQAWKNPR